ncbi:MAG: ArsR family transcriptional regulator, partial [Rhodococcus sp. (in: high G+C Gram-positive bacteria)]
VREVGELIAGATAAGKPLASFAIDSDITFATASDRAAFAGELGESINSLVAKYHDGNSEGGRKHRLVVALHPSLTTPHVTTPETEQ